MPPGSAEVAAPSSFTSRVDPGRVSVACAFDTLFVVSEARFHLKSLPHEGLAGKLTVQGNNDR